jgi:hydroxypyruvate isomerase
MLQMTRRELMTAAAAPVAAAALPADVRAATAAAQAAPPPPRYTLSANIELMFPKTMPHAERLQRIADAGLKAFSFWGTSGKDLAAMTRVQQQTGLACGSISGNPATGWKTGLTRTGFEAEFLKEFVVHAEVARRFNVKNLICFLGETQPDIPPDVQHRQCIDGLRKIGDLAAKHDVYFCLEPLNVVEYPRMSVLTATHGFRIVEEVNHPYVRLDYDMHQTQMGEGNIINNIRLGLRRGWIRFVEIGDVPGRLEPGTGEMHYENIFKVLREEGFADFVGMEHGTSSTPEHAMQVVRRVAGV